MNKTLISKNMKKTISFVCLIFIMFLILTACGKKDNKIKVTINIDDEIKVGETKSFDYSTTEDAKLEWNLSDNNILSIDVENKKVTGLKEGSCVITVTGENVEEAKVTIKVESSSVENIYTITYVLNGGENNPENPAEYKEGEIIRLKEAKKQGYKFLGWYNENDELVEKIEKDMSGNITLYAKWEELQQNKSEYKITYQLNGGNWNYESYQAVVEDLLNDYNTFGKTNYTVKSLPFGSWVNINFHTFFYEKVNGVYMKAKWGWLADYFGEVGGANNKKACSKLTGELSAQGFDSLNTNYKYAVSYEFRAFIKGEKFTTNTSYTSADYSLHEMRNGFWDRYGQKQNIYAYQKRDETIELSIPVKPYYVFDGWYKTEDFSDERIESPAQFKKDTTLYAKWVEENPVESITINNKVSEMLYDSSLQLKWTVLPENAGNPNVDFKSSDESIVTITSKGYMQAIGTGKVTITATSQANDKIFDSFEVEVYKPDRISAEYESTSFVEIGKSVKVNAEFIARNGEKSEVTFKSLNPEIATVEVDGLVTGISEGYAVILIEGKDKTLEVGITVVNKDASEILDLILKSHNSNIYVTEQMLIALAYRTDIYGSASDILFNYDYKEIELLTPLKSEGGSGNRPGNKMTSVEFITVHYTAGATPTSDAEATANYFKNGGGGASIHYCTGNDGIYHCMPDDEVAWHAGDGTGTKFEWIPTGVYQAPGDNAKPIIGVADDNYFTINGEKTKVLAPGGYDKVLGEYVDPDEKYFTLLGPAVDVFNGEYHIGTTWWCNSQVAEGRISSHGGNNNSIGIESACNQGSDLWYTWQITAQLVAKLMEENNLAINRVVGHNFFSGKNCPQPMLEKEGEIWYQFIECVESEYEIRTKFKDAKITSKSNDTSILKDNGRIAKQPKYTTAVSYTVTIEVGGKTESITLSSIIPGVYE